MSLSIKKLGALSGLLAVCCTLLLWGMGNRDTMSPKGGSAETSAPSAEIANDTPRSAVLHSTEQQRHSTPQRRSYDFSLTTQVFAGEDAQLAFQMAISGQMSATDAQDSTAGATLYQLSEIRVSRESSVAQAKEHGQSSPELEQAFLVRRDEQGHVLDVTTRASTSGLVDVIVRRLAASLQWVTVADPQANSWQELEQTALGEVLYRYRVLRKGQTLKQALRLVSELSPDGKKLARPATMPIEWQGGLVRTGSGGNWKSLHLAENQIQYLGEAQLRTHIEIRLTQKSQQALSRRQQWQSAPGDYRASLMARRQLAPRSPRQQWQKVLNGATEQELVAQLDALEPENVELQRDNLAQLEALLHLQPELARNLTPQVVAASETAASVALSALINVATPEAQIALHEVINADNIKRGRRESAIAGLGMVAEPTAETIEMAEDLSANPEAEGHRTATLALGNIAGHLIRAGEEQGEELFESLLRKLEQTTVPGEQVLFLSALGNTADLRLPQALQPWLEHETELLRVDATEALRLVGSDDALTTLGRIALTDEAPGVRRAALASLKFRLLERSLRVLSDALQGDPNVEVRGEALVALGRAQSPEAGELLAWAAENDPDETLRNRASQMLGDRG